jgi:hypothetical protein
MAAPPNSLLEYWLVEMQVYGYNCDCSPLPGARLWVTIRVIGAPARIATRDVTASASVPHTLRLRYPLIARFQIPSATSHIFVANVEPPHKQHDDGLLPSPLVSVVQLLHNLVRPTISCRAGSC